MVCGDCIQKLAIRLARNHKLDFIDALTRAYKGIERHERELGIQTPESTPSSPKVMPGKGNPTDYTQSCESGTCTTIVAGCTKAGNYCDTHTDCDNGSCACSGDCACPDPLPNSHQVSGCTQSCIPYGICGYCFVQWHVCVPSCACDYCASGSCGYDCDEGFEWNGEACVAPVEAPAAGLPPHQVIQLIVDT